MLLPRLLPYIPAASMQTDSMACKLATRYAACWANVQSVQPNVAELAAVMHVPAANTIQAACQFQCIAKVCPAPHKVARTAWLMCIVVTCIGLDWHAARYMSTHSSLCMVVTGGTEACLYAVCTYCHCTLCKTHYMPRRLQKPAVMYQRQYHLFQSACLHHRWHYRSCQHNDCQFLLCNTHSMLWSPSRSKTGIQKNSMVPVLVCVPPAQVALQPPQGLYT